jgi:hypothetical protein
MQGTDMLGRPFYSARLGEKDMGNYLATDKHHGKARKIFKFLGIYYSLDYKEKLA